MIFYDTIRTVAEFRRQAATQRAENFQTLSSTTDWKRAASSWGIQHLFACRVVCRQPNQVLPLIRDTVDALKRNKNEWHSVIKDLVNGPRQSKSTLGGMPEIEIVQAYGNGGLGHLWASLAPLVKTGSPPISDRNLRDREPSQSAISSTSSAGETLSPTPLSTGSNVSSIGYHETEWAPLLEDMTVRFASFFIRHILNYCQLLGKTSPIQYRDARKAHKSDVLLLSAIDYGGFEVTNKRGFVYQVAILEAKRAFQTIQNGTPTISNELLAQMVGEALGVIASQSSIFRNKVFVILAIKHFVKFFTFSISDQFIADFKSMNPADNARSDTYLYVDSTVWFDATDNRGRLHIVSHVMALVECADEVVSPAEDE